jgi:hypothetical protein
MLWSPTIRAALVAGTPWLDVFCPGCGTSRTIDSSLSIARLGVELTPVSVRPPSCEAIGGHGFDKARTINRSGSQGWKWHQRSCDGTSRSVWALGEVLEDYPVADFLTHHVF